MKQNWHTCVCDKVLVSKVRRRSSQSTRRRMFKRAAAVVRKSNMAAFGDSKMAAGQVVWAVLCFGQG